MDLSTITVQQFKDRFYRDFTFANQNPTQPQPLPPDAFDVIQDIDIQNAYADTISVINQCLFPNETVITNAFLLLAAHNLCLNIKAADSGINSKGTFPISSKSVGSVSVAYEMPEAYKNSALLAGYASTQYGQKYLNMVLPYLVGNVNTVFGGALP